MADVREILAPLAAVARALTDEPDELVLASFYGAPQGRIDITARIARDALEVVEALGATIEQARAGGCCLCRPDCRGVDVEPGEQECDPMCSFCMHGCAAPAPQPCSCVSLQQIMGTLR